MIKPHQVAELLLRYKIIQERIILKVVLWEEKKRRGKKI